ncbi:MAG: ATP-dependent sacrificial sulfur transferase LarE [Synechococcaceae cyanobacterium]|nr:ATP-dependent sacrificial sulfur transferase LarE [Synechococcaceae cyanobacterium]
MASAPVPPAALPAAAAGGRPGGGGRRGGQFDLLESLAPQRAEALAALRALLASWPAVVVAYSGGVDSALVAALAVESLGEGAEAITGVSPALAPHLRREARAQARWLGLRQREIDTAELADPAYADNPGDRCRACKSELHRRLAAIAAAAGGIPVLDGVNRDDLGDHRPGIAAARAWGVRSPLAEVGLDKAGVRAISRALGLPWWDKPAQPCLASRFPYGEPISRSRLERVAAAEEWLRQRGWSEIRVRCQGETARIELPAARLATTLAGLAEGSLRGELIGAFLSLGFTAVSLDLEGLVSGKLNRDLA